MIDNIKDYYGATLVYGIAISREDARNLCCTPYPYNATHHMELGEFYYNEDRSTYVIFISTSMKDPFEKDSIYNFKNRNRSFDIDIWKKELYSYLDKAGCGHNTPCWIVGNLYHGYRHLYNI